MPDSRQPLASPLASRMWPEGGAHLWPSGETAPPHSHARGHLVYAAHGVLSIHAQRGTSMVPANRVAWTPAGVMHYHRAYGQTDMRILFMPVSLARLLPRDPAVLPASPLAREAFLALTGPRNDATDAHRFLPGARARLRRVLLDELQSASELPLQLPEPRDDRLQAIAQRLYERPADNTRLTELGRAIGASPRTLSRLFHDELGMTFHEWRTQVRVHHALVMLADGHSTTDVSLACGWTNPSHFIAAFTKITGTSPGRYRATSGRPASGAR